MAKPPPTPGAERTALPDGPPSHVRFDGLLQGRLLDQARLDSGVAKLADLGLGRLAVEVDMGRFSVLPPEQDLPGAVFDEAGRAALVEALRELVAAAERGSVDSSLRATFVWSGRQAVDTLFAIQNGELVPVGAIRSAQATDEIPAATGADNPLASRRMQALLGVGGLLAVMLLLWQTPTVQGLFAPSFGSLKVRVAPAAADFLRAAVVEEDGESVLAILPGDALPQSVADFDKAWEHAPDLGVRRGLLQLLAAEGRVLVLDADGQTLASGSFDADPLLRGDSVRWRPPLLPSGAAALRVELRD